MELSQLTPAESLVGALKPSLLQGLAANASYTLLLHHIAAANCTHQRF